jgi:hypothetical protein
MVAGQAVVCEDPDSQNRHLVLHIEDGQFGKSNEVSKAIPIQNISRLPIFFAKLQAIKTSHSWFMVIPRSLDRQYSPELHPVVMTCLHSVLVSF